MAMTFEDWQATRKWVDVLADVTGLDHDDYPSGWIYRDGAEHIESVEWGCRVVIEQSEREFKDLEEAERYLWDEWARDQANDGGAHQTHGRNMAHTIAYVGMFGRDGKQLQVSDGYRADDYLPGYDGQEFENEDLAKRWIETNHKGPDVDGVEARFVVVSN